MIVEITGILIVIYCLYQMIDIDMFVKKFAGIRLDNTIDAFVLVATIIWLVVQFFFQSGPIALIPLVFGFINPFCKSERKTFFLHRLILIVIILDVSFIVLNKLWFNINFWNIF